MTVVALPVRPRLPAVALPPGQWHQRLWLSDQPLAQPDVYRACVAEYEHSGLWPVLTPGGDRDWPRHTHNGKVIDLCGARSTYRGDRFAEAGNLGWVRAAPGQYRLALVPVGRPADVPACWGGATTPAEDVSALSAMLRSWEDRFGATLITLGSDVLELAVAAPPKNLYRALAVAAEHRSFCPDGSRHESLREYAKGLVNQRYWRFRPAVRRRTAAVGVPGRAGEHRSAQHSGDA